MKIIKKLAIILIIFLSFIIIESKSNAAALTVGFSKSTANVGDTISVTVNGSGIAGKVSLSVSGNATLSQNSVWVDNSATTVTLTVNGSGNISVTATPVDVSDSTTAQPYTNATKGTITVSSTNTTASGTKSDQTNASTTKSSVATLANLGIKPNDFSGFKPNTTSYSTEVPNDVETIEIYASKGQSGQTITGTGKKNLKEGTNTFEISVTAEDGKTKKTYTLNITRKTNEEEKDKKDETETETEEGEEEPIDIFGLSELKIKNLKLSPEFQTDIYEYKIELTEDIDKLDISTVATDVNSNIEITGNEQLEEGENIITILVTGEDGEKSAAYQIIVNKKTTTIEDVENEDKYDMKKIIIIAGAGALTLIVVILIIVKVIKNKKDNQYYDDDYEEYDDYEDEDDYNDTEEIDENNDNEDLTTDFINDEPSEDYYKEEKIKKKKRSKGKRFK